jgi:hypothetical protein
MRRDCYLYALVSPFLSADAGRECCCELSEVEKGVWRSLNSSKWGKDNDDIEDKGTDFGEQECQGGIMSDFLIRRVMAMAERVTVPTSAIFGI